MNDLIISHSFTEAFEGLKKAFEVFESIKNFDDIERLFLYGNGLSPHTYRSYLTSVRLFYDFSGRLHPLLVKPSHLEQFYDYTSKKCDRNTARLRIMGLKKFFLSIKKIIPIYTSPFELMDERLRKKLNRTKKGNRTRKALAVSEVKTLLGWLKNDTTVQGLENYAIVYTLVTSGLRADELCQLRWKDVEMVDGKWTALFVGKGGKDAEQELYGPAVEACRNYFRAAFGRDPQGDDSLFWTLPRYPGDGIRPLPYHALWSRVRQVGEKAKAEGVIKRDIIFSPHLFRRTYATMLYKNGMGLKAVQAKTRHANIDTLLKHYIHDDEAATPYLERVLR